ncbi:hypothetical protein GSI_11506 [Ganoderma sinense ZZ0214-1]|uniref:Uncharacterized protein n=1 Tax=Ganoderma sinense ZZ0214-1 TaxID=1077348 RepID=A0A2G8RW62_9APHY|nr:hypothetical protein GSI_11506 [Ganoderma sinense ZZ0214-1]
MPPSPILPNLIQPERLRAETLLRGVQRWVREEEALLNEDLRLAMLHSAESALDPGEDTYSVEGVTWEDLQSTEQRWNDYIHNLMGGEPDCTSNSPPRSPSPAGSDDDDLPALLRFYALNDTMWLAQAPLPWRLIILQRDGTMMLVPDNEFADELCPRVLEMLVMDRHREERERAGLALYGAPIMEMLGGDLSEAELEHEVLLLEDVLCHRDNVAATWIPAHAPNRYHDIFLLNVDPEPWRSIQRDHSIYSLLQYTLVTNVPFGAYLGVSVSFSGRFTSHVVPMVLCCIVTRPLVS